MQVVFMNGCKISNQMFFNVMFSFSETKGEMVMPYCKIKLFSEAIFHGPSSNESEVYLEPS